MFSFVWRLGTKIDKTKCKQMNITPWTIYIWDEFQKLDNIPYPSTPENITGIKALFDDFLQKLYIYYSITICELKAANSKTQKSSNEYFTKSLQSVSVLRDILYNCKWLETFYPNLLSFFKAKQTHSIETRQSQLNDHTNLHASPRYQMENLWKVMFDLLEAESIIYDDKFPRKGKTLFSIDRNINPKLWKVVILCKDNSLTEGTQKFLKYCLPVPIHFVNSLEVDKILQNHLCVREKMIDTNLFVYIYHSKE